MLLDAFRFLWLLLLVLMSGCELDATPSSGGSTPPSAQTDLAKLRTVLRLPEGIERARFVVKPLRLEGSRLVPGPTDTLLLVWLQPSAAALANQAAFSGRVASPFKLELADAEALLPKEWIGLGKRHGGWLELTCQALDSDFGTAGHQQTHLVRCGDSILGRFASR